MSKLNASDKFLDLSDYGRSFGRFFALQLKETRFTPIHVTLLFGISGLLAIYCILNQFYFAAAFFIILKSGIDAADGEKIPLYMVADIVSTAGPNTITRENVERKTVVSANVAGRDQKGAVDDIRQIINEQINLPQGYRFEYGGQFEAEAEASKTAFKQLSQEERQDLLDFLNSL